MHPPAVVSCVVPRNRPQRPHDRCLSIFRSMFRPAGPLPQSMAVFNAAPAQYAAFRFVEDAVVSVKAILVGCGNMGFAMLAGWLKCGKLSASEVFVVEPNADLRNRAAGLGIATGTSAGDLPADTAPRLIILAVKPQVIRDVSAQYRRFGASTPVFLSVAAGTPVATFSEVLGNDTPIVRVMPNTPAAIGKGMMVVFANSRVPARELAFINELLATSGAVTSIDDEALMDAVTAVSGSGPAYVFHFIECLTAAGEAAGLPLATAKLLAMQTVFGAASLAAESGEEPALLRQQVTSPNGTTAAALGVLMGNDRLKTLVTEAVEAARARSVELGK
jgi:pyrroline-5-carboxylate reductase